MELEEVGNRLVPFIRTKLQDPNATIENVARGPGHAGFSYFFDTISDGLRTSYFLRLPPPGVKHEGTADVMRQVAAIRTLQGTNVPHAPILWASADEDWFGVPYFVQPRLDGDTLKDEWPLQFSDAQLRAMARDAMTALAGIHKVDPANAPYLGQFWGYEFDVTRWDRFYERAAEPELLALQPRVKQLLLENIPHDARIAVYHGDFQWSNLLYSRKAELLAVIDWPGRSARFYKMRKFNKALLSTYLASRSAEEGTNFSAAVPGWKQYLTAKDLMGTTKAPQQSLTITTLQ